MKPFIVLLVVSGLALLILKIATGTINLPLSARIGMAVMLLFTALGHFVYTDGMVMMLPAELPYRRAIVYATAVLEILGAIGLHIPHIRPLAAWLLILFLILVLPANIRASMEHLNYQKASLDGPGLAYLWFRIPMQLVFIGWIYISAIRFG
jgi:uncharacterized membrane protein